MEMQSIFQEMGEWVLRDGVLILLIFMGAGIAIKFTRLVVDRLMDRHAHIENTKLSTEKLRPLLYNILRIMIVLFAVVCLMQILGFNWAAFMRTAFGLWLVGSGLKILMVIAVATLLMKIISIALDHVFKHLGGKQDDEMRKRSDTLKAVVRNFVHVVLIAVALMMILDNLGLDIGPILASAGVLGLAVGFGAQQLVRDVINGFFILLDDQIRVGDVVSIAGQGGLVESVNLRLTKLRDLSGNVHYVRNGEITVVTNMTKEYSRYVFDVGIAYREDVDQVIEVLKEIDAEMRNDEEYGSDILEPLEILGLDRFDDSAVIVRVRTKTKPIRQWAVGREFNRRMKKRFDDLGIEIPFPHVTLYMGQDKDGSAPAMNVKHTGN
jgi:small conductance mechanosensitive channel